MRSSASMNGSSSSSTWRIHQRELEESSSASFASTRRTYLNIDEEDELLDVGKEDPP